MIESLKTGLWLTPDRLRTYPILLLALFSIALFCLILTRHGLYDRFDRPLGPDFTEVWAAGQDVLEGHPANAYDAALHREKQAELFGPSPDFYLWSYPPYFLGIAAFLALFPYLIALLIWQAATLPLYLAAVCASLKSIKRPFAETIVPAIAFPAVFINLAHGQNGFLTAALLTGGLIQLKTRPVIAGILFACLAYKPQFAVMIPVALIAGGHWRAIAAGVAALGLLTLTTLAAFGAEIWFQFLQGIGLAKNLVLEQGGAGYEKMQSVFAAARLTGASLDQAYIVQALAIGILIAGIAWLWHSSADDRLKAAGLLTSVLLATPYCFDYDMLVLGPAVAWAVDYSSERGFQSYEKSFFAGIWALPLVARPLATALSIPAGAFLAALFFAMLILRARRDAVLPSHASRSLELAA